MKYAFLLIFVLLFFSLCTEFATAQTNTSKATFAGGCYWCMEEVFDGLEQVISATSGFAAVSSGKSSSGSTGRVEAVEVVYDRSSAYRKLREAHLELYAIMLWLRGCRDRD